MASRKGGIGIGTIILLLVVVYFAWTQGALTGLMPGGIGGTTPRTNGIVLDGPLNVNLVNALSGATVDGEGIEIYKPGSTTAQETWDVDSDTAADSSLNYKSGDTYFFIVCDGTAAQSAGVGCEGTDGGVREFGALDAVRGVSVTIPFASNTQQTQHNIAIAITLSFDDDSTDISWTVISGTESMTDNDGSTTDNDWSGNGGASVAAESEEFTSTQTHSITLRNTVANTGFNQAFTFPDSGNTVDLRLIVYMRNENGTGTAHITNMPLLYSAGSTDFYYDFGSLYSCIQREVVGTLIKQGGTCTFTFTVETGSYTSANGNTQVNIWIAEYFDATYFARTGSVNPEAFLNAASPDNWFDFFIQDS